MPAVIPFRRPPRWPSSFRSRATGVLLIGFARGGGFTVYAGRFRLRRRRRQAPLDNVTHSLAGMLLRGGRVRLARRDANHVRAAAYLVSALANNLPDADVAARGFPGRGRW